MPEPRARPCDLTVAVEVSLARNFYSADSYPSLSSSYATPSTPVRLSSANGDT